MFSGPEIVHLLHQLDVTHVVWVPDSTLGKWEPSLRHASGLRLINVCREGEAWAVALGLHLGGARPIVIIQCTGLFESGDSMRNTLHDFQLPIPSIIGHRSYLNDSTLPGDTAKVYAEPILRAWNLDYRQITDHSQLPQMLDHLKRAAASGRAGVILLAEGRA